MYSLALSSFVLALCVVGSPVSPKRRNDDGSKRAAYILDNNPAGNSIISIGITEDGYLSSPTRTWTKGKGLYGVTATGDSGPDSLFGQDAVVVEGNYLFTINPGSHTLSMFYIDPEYPTHPVLVGEPADTMGDFPMAVAYSSEIKTACVLNGGTKASVACFLVDHAKGLAPLDKAPRTISLGIAQTTPPMGPPNTAADILFNPSGTALFAIVKGNSPTPGSYYVWPVVDGKVSAKTTPQAIADMPLPFGAIFLGSDSKILVSDPSFGGSIVEVGANYALTETVHIVIPGQQAMCWTQYSSRFHTAFLLDAGLTNITTVNPDTGAVNGLIVMDPTVGGAFDSALDRRWLYVLGGDDTVEVISLEGSNSGKTPKQVQKFSLAGFAERKGLQGLAIYPSE